MAKYFDGRREIGEFEQEVENGRGKVHCRIFEEWVDADSSTTARCGADGSCTVERMIGLSEKATSTLKGVIEASIGIKDVAGIKSQIEESIGREVNWSETKRTSKTFPIKAPSCGRSTLTIYELVRIYELSYSKKNWNILSSKKWIPGWKRTLREITDNHDGIPEFMPFDEQCNCKEQRNLPPPDGRVIFDFGLISIRVPYRLTDIGFDVQIMDKIVSLSFTDRQTMVRGLDHGFDVTLPVSYIPEPLLFLGDVTSESINGTLTKEELRSLEESGTALTEIVPGMLPFKVEMKEMRSVSLMKF